MPYARRLGTAQPFENDRSAPGLSDRDNGRDIGADVSDRFCASDAAMEERFEDIAVLGAEIARLESMLARSSAEISALTTRLDQERTTGLSPDHAELAIGELSRQLDLKDRTLSEVIADRDRLINLVEEILGTTSWKATARLRKLKSMFNRLTQS